MPEQTLPPAPCPMCQQVIPQRLVVCPECGGDLIAATRTNQPASGGAIFGAVFGGILAAVAVLFVLYVVLVNVV